MTYTPERLRQIDAQIHKLLTGVEIEYNAELVPESGRVVEVWRPLKPDGTRFPFEYWSFFSEEDAWEGINGLPYYTTDANTALGLMEAGWYLSRDEPTQWHVIDEWDEYRSSDEITPALAVCRARFPELFEEVGA